MVIPCLVYPLPSLTFNTFPIHAQQLPEVETGTLTLSQY